MTTHIDRRIAVLERQQGNSRPLLVFGTPTAEQREAIAHAERIGRPVIFWPLAPPLIEQDGSKA